MAQLKRLIDMVVERYDEGMSVAQIARELQVSRSLVEYVLESEALQCAESIAEARAS